ncbi:DUF2381 family protein [Cystobacter ferrugineus]
MAPAARAGGSEKLSVRSLLLSEHPSHPTHRVYVKAQVVTTLRFEKAVDPDKTKMLGWEGRLEPLAVVRNKVILEPLHALGSDEAIPLVVTLVDGTEVAFLLRSRDYQDWALADQQIDVFQDRESYAAMHDALMRALDQNDALSEQLARYRQEEHSGDHALAALLTAGALEQTPFKLAGYVTGKDDAADVNATLYKGKGKAAVVFRIKNLSPEQPWSMTSARVLSVVTGQERPVAARSLPSKIGPGESGVVAIVADRSAFMEDGKLTSVFLEVYRNGGLRQAFIQLDPDLVAK